MNVILEIHAPIPENMEGQFLLSLEREIRKITLMDIRVFKQKMGDDSKLRIRMSPEEREKL